MYDAATCFATFVKMAANYCAKARVIRGGTTPVKINALRFPVTTRSLICLPEKSAETSAFRR
jgi:hypothetical protein